MVYFNYYIIIAKVIVYNTRTAKNIISLSDRSLAAKLSEMCYPFTIVRECDGLKNVKICMRDIKFSFPLVFYTTENLCHDL